ncbi:MAG: S24 family peptidase [Bacteroidetes bacterium]|nr:S24 family peptidase [Bacteroidota bacterium]
MIRDDRIQLNERFRKVFKLLEERGEIVLNDRGGRGMGDFAEKILGNRAYGHIIRAFLNPADKRVIDYRHARILCREYNVNESYMIDGIGTPFGFDIPQQEVSIGKQLVGNILYTTTEAFAGATIGTDDFTKEDHDFFTIPGIKGGGLVAFPISGNSMEPVILDEDIVICREIGSAYEIKDNKIYAVKNNGALWVKYVQKIPDHKGRVAHLKLISANHLEHDPFIEEVNEHTRLYQVIRRVSDLQS